MIRRIGPIVLLLFALAIPALATEFTTLTGPYLGQTPPGSTPRLFAPGIVSVFQNFEHSAAVFSPDGSEVFWCTNVNTNASAPAEGLRLYTMMLIDGFWTEPERAAFTEHLDVPISRPVFSPDGDRLYMEYYSNPAVESHADIYVSERVEGGWSIPQPVSLLINSPAIERLHCVTADGSMIFTRNLMTSREAVFISHYVDGEFTEPEELGDAFNSEAWEFSIVLPQDESYMLTAISRTGREDEVYISYREADGSWTERMKTPYSSGGFLALSPDDAYLFYLGDGIYWVDTSFVERLKPEHLK